MAECVYCKAETELFDSGTPVCPKCSEPPRNQAKTPMSDAEIRNILNLEFQGAQDRARAAIAAFDAVTSEISPNPPTQDGEKRVYRASREVTVARMEMLRAHHRLSDFLSAGVVPEDLKRSATSSPSSR